MTGFRGFKADSWCAIMVKSRGMKHAMMAALPHNCSYIALFHTPSWMMTTSDSQPSDELGFR